MAMLCVIGWLFPGLASLWLPWVPSPEREWLVVQNPQRVNQPWFRHGKTLRRIRAPCFRGIWGRLGLRLKGG